MYGHFMRENREIPWLPKDLEIMGRIGKAQAEHR